MCQSLNLQFQSTHPVRGGTKYGWDYIKAAGFQSTHPVRGGTPAAARPCCPTRYFNPPTPCGVGPCRPSCCAARADFNPPTPCGVGPRAGDVLDRDDRISIHPPRAGWDKALDSAYKRLNLISIHPPRAGWDFTHQQGDLVILISIHPPRAGWDIPNHSGVPGQSNFNPPTPCGVGLELLIP